MIRKICNYSWFRFIVVPTTLFIVLTIFYSSYSKKIPITFRDEIHWVGRSYFFQYFIEGDFNNSIWQSPESYDQPKLAEYSYGAWLYPTYLSDKARSLEKIDYTTFLIKNGFYEINENYNDSYSSYLNKHPVIKFDEHMGGFPDEWTDKYGQEALKPINLIYKARVLSIFLLAGSVVISYFLSLQLRGITFATVFSIFYGLNPLIIEMGIRAHSEALFLFTFNMALLFMILYFAKERKITNLLLFSFFTGLNISTKLNGSILLIIFLAVNSICIVFTKKEMIKHFLIGLLPVIICMSIFVVLNPYTCSDPITNTLSLFIHRWRMASYQALSSPEYYIPPGIVRIVRIFSNFYFSEMSRYFNGNQIFSAYLVKINNYGVYLFVLLLLGLIYSIKQISKNKVFMIILISFVATLGSMYSYLILDWGRYYIHLVIFLLLFQGLGLVFLKEVISSAKKTVKINKEKINTFLLLFVCIPILIYVIKITIQIVQWPYDLNSVEGILLFNLREFISDGNLYGHSQHALEYINTYAPPYYLLVGAVNKFIEISTSLTRLRIFTLALELLIGLAIYLLIRIKTKDFLSAFLGFITFLSLISINKFHVIVRIDYLYILFILLSVYFLVRFKESGKSFLLLYFIIFGTLSIFTKIPAIATFATITLYHFVNYKKESRILISISIIALLCLILFIVTNKVTSGGFYLHTIANQLSKPIDRDTAKTFLADLFVTYRILIFPVIYLLLKYRKYVDPLYLVLFLSSITEATLSIFKLGGDQNYFILPISLLCVVLFSTKRKVYEIYNIVIPICFVLLSIGGYYRWCLTEASYKQNQDFERSFSTIDDEYLLTNNVYPFYKSDRKLFTNDLFQYSINSQVKRQNGVPDIFLRGVKFNYIFTSYYSYVKSVNIFPIDEFELIYETNNNCLKQEIWKRKQAQ